MALADRFLLTVKDKSATELAARPKKKRTKLFNALPADNYAEQTGKKT